MRATAVGSVVVGFVVGTLSPDTFTDMMALLH
jgi:hypothetical protein